ncbi:MAG TPA: hypothetical protein VFZ32_18365 [Micromonosporaceae bacterium]
MKARGSTRTTLWAGLLCVLLLVIFGFIGIPRAVLYATGEQVTAQVTDCQTETRRGRRGRTSTVTTCTGTWNTRDGQQHSGEIEGADDEHRGRQVSARVNGEKALLDRPFLLWPAGAFCLVLVAGIAGAGYLIMRRRAQAGEAGPSGPGASPDRGAPPGVGPYPPGGSPPPSGYVPYGQQPPGPPPEQR